MPATTTPVFRKLRRSGPAGGRQRSTQVDESGGVAGAPGSVDDAARLSGLRSSAVGPSSPDRAVPVRGLIGSAAGGAARTSSTSATAAAAPPTSDGSTKLAEAVGRDSAAVTPIAVNTARPAIPYQILRMASRPTIAANTASTARMPVTRTSLSFEPKAEIAKFFTGRRREVDRRLAHGHDRRAVRGHDPGDELADADRHGGGEQPGDQPPGGSRRDRSQESH